MSLLLIIGLVFLLYIRTLNYNYVIDDNVRREGYMYDVPLMAPPPEFFDTKPSPWYRLFMIGMHCVNVSIVYMIWGWAPALLFAVHPLSVCVTAWVTGNYYATAAYFTLIAFFALHTFPNLLGALIAMPLFAAALNSTVCPITFPFVFLFGSTPWGLTMLFPLAMFLRGKRFQTGISIRKSIANETHVKNKFHFRRIALMTKVVARYTYNTLVPIKTGFFDGYGHNARDHKDIYDKYCSFNVTFWVSLALCLSVFAAGLLIHPFGIFWFFTFVMLHSQWNFMGQFFALRYLYIPLVGMCVVVGTALAPYPILMAIVTTLLVVKTHYFIYAWRNQEEMWKNDVVNYPNWSQPWNNYAQYLLSEVSLDRMGKKRRKHVPDSRINETIYYLLRADEMEPDCWQIKMNISCFFSLIGEWDRALQKTNEAIALLKPLGGIKNPMIILEKQKASMESIIAKLKPGATNLTQEQGGSDDKREEEGTGVFESIGSAESSR